MQMQVISRIQALQQCPFHHNPCLRLKKPTLTKGWTMLISPTCLKEKPSCLQTMVMEAEMKPKHPSKNKVQKETKNARFGLLNEKISLLSYLLNYLKRGLWNFVSNALKYIKKSFWKKTISFFYNLWFSSVKLMNRFALCMFHWSPKGSCNFSIHSVRFPFAPSF